MKVLGLSKMKPGTTISELGPYLEQEGRIVAEMRQAGIFSEMYFRGESHDVVIILESHGLEDAKLAVESLPLVKAGLLSFDLIPLKPFEARVGRIEVAP